ncbi:kinase-like domain-containing protein, partial [Fusarium oxysporum II5]
KETRRKLCLYVCQGLHMLRSCGIVHGDVKAENVLVFPNEKNKYKAKLSDFGYSLVMNTEKRNLSLGGTRPWKAPEAKTAVWVSDTKYTDIYSLSLLIWFTFAHGRNIFKLLLDPSKHGEEFYAEAEKIKETGELATHTDLSTWY